VADAASARGRRAMHSVFLAPAHRTPRYLLARRSHAAGPSSTDYPFDDRDNLVTVSQFVAIKLRLGMAQRGLAGGRSPGAKRPIFAKPDEPHGVLADLPLPVFMTTKLRRFHVRGISDAAESQGRAQSRMPMEQRHAAGHVRPGDRISADGSAAADFPSAWPHGSPLLWCSRKTTYLDFSAEMGAIRTSFLW